MLSTQLELPDGVLAVTVQHAPQVSVIFGLVPAGSSDVHETYGNVTCWARTLSDRRARVGRACRCRTRGAGGWMPAWTGMGRR